MVIDRVEETLYISFYDPGTPRQLRIDSSAVWQPRRVRKPCEQSRNLGSRTVSSTIFSSPPNEVSHYFLYIYIKRWSSFAGGGGGLLDDFVAGRGDPYPPFPPPFPPSNTVLGGRGRGERRSFPFALGIYTRRPGFSL